MGQLFTKELTMKISCWYCLLLSKYPWNPWILINLNRLIIEKQHKKILDCQLQYPRVWWIRILSRYSSLDFWKEAKVRIILIASVSWFRIVFDNYSHEKNGYKLLPFSLLISSTWVDNQRLRRNTQAKLFQ